MSAAKVATLRDGQHCEPPIGCAAKAAALQRDTVAAMRLKITEKPPVRLVCLVPPARLPKLHRMQARYRSCRCVTSAVASKQTARAPHCCTTYGDGRAAPGCSIVPASDKLVAPDNLLASDEFAQQRHCVIRRIANDTVTAVCELFVANQMR